MHKIMSCLWFDGNAEEAVNFYASVFRDTKITNVTHYGEAGPGEKGSVLTITFELYGQPFMALNGGPEFKFNEAVSIVVNVESQDELDGLWDKLTSDGGEPSYCGWLKDKFGLSWQIVPARLVDMISSDESDKSERVMEALLKMRKLDVATLEKAYAG